MKDFLRYLLLTLGLFLLIFGYAEAKDVTLAWDQNPEPDVVGYKVYYKAESSAAPLDGWGASEGDSPIIVGNRTSARISGLQDNQTYYFAVSAFNASGVESPLSDIVASATVPVLTSPARGAVAVARPITFHWDYAPFAPGMSYTLLVGTDPRLPVTGSQVAAQSSNPIHRPAIAGLLGLGLFGSGLAARRNRIRALLFWTAAGLSLTACGGGGGGNDGVASGLAVTTPGHGGATLVLNQLTTPFATVAELQPGTTYYWQVVAVDANGYRYESLVHSFSTAQ